MPLDYDKLLNWRPPEVRQRLARKDTILYALGLGLGADPMDERQLRFVYEKDLLALPTIATVLASPAFWMKAPEFGLDWHKILHGEEAFEISTPIPAEGELIGRTRVAAIVDKGADKGALALIERTISEAQTGQTIATVKSTAFMQRYGGFGGPSGPTPELHQLPNRAPDLTYDAPTLPQAALIYRLSGDYNPLHADPEVARQGGFRQPILHGLCSLGIAGHKPELGVPWRLLILAKDRAERPFSGAKRPPVAFICELKTQVRVGPVPPRRGPVCDIGSHGRWSWGISNPNATETMISFVPAQRPGTT